MSQYEPRRNQTAADRRDAVLDAAIAEFARLGLHGASTEDIARRAGISQPYIFRLFGTKKDLFLAAVDRVNDRVAAGFREVATATSGEQQPPLRAMGLAYHTLLANRASLGMLLQSFAASGGDPAVQEHVRRRFAELYDYVREATGIGEEEATVFFSQGMLITVAAALDLPQVLGFADWEAFERHCLEPGFQLSAAPPSMAGAGSISSP
jgi:AcrR family transcriptional regulator